MRRFNFLFALLTGLVLVFACGKPEQSSTIPVESVSLNKTELNLIEGGSETLTATVAPGDATDRTVTWSSADATVATVEQNGYVTAVKEGKTTVTAMAGGKSASCTVTVTKPIKFSITPNSAELEAEGGKFTVTVTCGTTYHIDSKPDWVTEESVTNMVHTFSVPANPASEERSGVIVFCDDKGTCMPCTVKQKAGTGSIEFFDWSQAFSHRSLMMRFTATWCGWCPRMNKSVRLAQEQNPGKIEVLNLHGGGSTLDFSGTSSLMSQYGIEGFPTGVLDGRRLVENYDIDYTASLIGKYMQETEQNYPVSSAIGFESSWSGQTLSVDVSLYLRYAANYKATVLLLEDGIVKAQTDYEEGNHSNYVHDNIARMAISNINGSSFSTTGDQIVKHLKYTVAVPSIYNKSKLRILVYVQREFGSQTVLQSASYGDYYVDNCASGEAGGSLAPSGSGQGDRL